MPKVIVSQGTSFEIVRDDRSFGAPDGETLMSVDGSSGAVAIPSLQVEDLSGAAGETLSTLGTDVQTLVTHSPFLTDNLSDFNFISDRTFGALGFLKEQRGLYVAVPPSTLPYIPPANEEVCGNSDDSIIWVRVDKMQVPYKLHREFFLGTILADQPSITNTGLTADSGLKSMTHFATRFGNNLDGFADVAENIFVDGIHGDSAAGFTDAAEILIAAPFPDSYDPENPDIVPDVDPFQPNGDFGGAFGAEILSGEEVAVFLVVRINADGKALLAQSDTEGNAAGILAVAQNQGSPSGGLRRGVIARYRDVTPVVLQTGITPALGDKLYLSATQAGKVTNVAPANEYPIGRVLSFVDGVCRVVLNIT